LYARKIRINLLKKLPYISTAAFSIQSETFCGNFRTASGLIFSASIPREFFILYGQYYSLKAIALFSMNDAALSVSG